MQKLPTIDLWPFSALSPILPVELGRQARKPSHFWMRMAFAVILGGILLATLWHFASYGRATFSNVPSIARFLFYLLTALGFFIPIQLPMLASGVLKREYETNRMHFLLGTPLSSIEILVGKVLASLIPAFELLWIALPAATFLAVMSGIALLDWLLWNFSIALCLGTSREVGWARRRR